ncbi:hypothetical protein [Grimontia hollisae]|uniref:hypothetical protein n=1 Tax=Grimontia hollisae TaxID=673 RepID=UPI0018EED9A4|nr:hypothetical protein [Grimontia hollisae]
MAALNASCRRIVSKKNRYWVLGTGYWVLGTGYWVLGTGYWVLGTGYWVLGTGYWVLQKLELYRNSFKLFAFLRT